MHQTPHECLLKLPSWGGSNKYPQSYVFEPKLKRKMNAPVNSTLPCIQWSFLGCSLHGLVLMMKRKKVIGMELIRIIPFFKLTGLGNKNWKQSFTFIHILNKTENFRVLKIQTYENGNVNMIQIYHLHNINPSTVYFFFRRHPSTVCNISMLKMTWADKKKREAMFWCFSRQQSSAVHIHSNLKETTWIECESLFPKLNAENIKSWKLCLDVQTGINGNILDCYGSNVIHWYSNKAGFKNIELIPCIPQLRMNFILILNMAHQSWAWNLSITILIFVCIAFSCYAKLNQKFEKFIPL